MSLEELKAIYGRLVGIHSPKHVWKYGASKMKFSTVAEGLEKIKNEYLNGGVPKGEFADYLVFHFDECFDASIDLTLAILAIQEFRQWTYKMEGDDAIETFGGTEELSMNEFYGFSFIEGRSMQLPDGVRVGIKRYDGGVVLDEGIIACFLKEEESLTPCDCIIQDTEEDSVSPVSATVLTGEQMSILKTQIATVVTEYRESVTTSQEDSIIKVEHTFDNGLVLLQEEKTERGGWHEYRMFYIVHGLTFKLKYWDCNGIEWQSKDLKMPHVINLLSVMRQYNRDSEKNNRLIKLASLSMSSQTFFDREMSYLVA